MQYFIFTPFNLQDISIGEWNEHFKNVTENIEILSAKHIIITTKCKLDTLELTELRTVDDICILLSLPDKSELNRTYISDVINEAISKYQHSSSLSISFSTSFYKPDFSDNTDFHNKEALIDFLNRLEVIHNHITTKTDTSELHFRIIIDGQKTYILQRILKDSLTKLRNYITLPGSLSPIIAASIVKKCINIYREKNNTLPASLADFTCGAGTILCEAFRAGLAVFGSDIDRESVEAARINLEKLGCLSPKIRVQDATQPFKHDNADIVICNLPWNKQISIPQETTYLRNMAYNIARVVKQSGILALITSRADLVISTIKQLGACSILEKIQISTKGQRAWVVVARKT